MKKSLAFLLIVAMFFIPFSDGTLAEDDINFHDAKTKFYNGNGQEKVIPQSIIVLENTFSVIAQRTIYFILEDSQDNLPILEPESWKVRLVVRNSWNFTDFGVFGDGAPLTAPTDDYVLIPSETYTLETKVSVPLASINYNDTYEISVILAVKSEGSYNPSHSLSHYIQFASEEIPPPPPPPPPPPEPEPDTQIQPDYATYLLAIGGIAIGVCVTTIFYIIIKAKQEDEGDQEEN